MRQVLFVTFCVFALMFLCTSSTECESGRSKAQAQATAKYKVELYIPLGAGSTAHSTAKSYRTPDRVWYTNSDSALSNPTAPSLYFRDIETGLRVRLANGTIIVTELNSEFVTGNITIDGKITIDSGPGTFVWEDNNDE